MISFTMPDGTPPFWKYETRALVCFSEECGGAWRPFILHSKAFILRSENVEEETYICCNCGAEQTYIIQDQPTGYAIRLEPDEKEKQDAEVSADREWLGDNQTNS